ncbi:MAG: type II toxin-antitoxin system HicA family toxin [Acidobacteria bacterium]|nr:type II toxin-antitoxin system HicA family toxin [Acidobacteriota bacterium]
MKATEFKRWLSAQGCRFEPAKGGHLKVKLGNKMSILPMHGAGKELGPGLVFSILRQLGLKKG